MLVVLWNFSTDWWRIFVLKNRHFGYNSVVVVAVWQVGGRLLKTSPLPNIIPKRARIYRWFNVSLLSVSRWRAHLIFICCLLSFIFVFQKKNWRSHFWQQNTSVSGHKFRFQIEYHRHSEIIIIHNWRNTSLIKVISNVMKKEKKIELDGHVAKLCWISTFCK